MATRFAQLHHLITSAWTDQRIFVLFGVVCIIVIILVFLRGALGRLLPSGGSRRSHTLSFFQKRKLIRRAEYLMEDGDYHQAGSLLDSIGEFDLALQAYLKGNDLPSAAQLAEKIQRYNQAAAIHAKMGQYDRAAALYERAEVHHLARENYIAAAAKAAKEGKNFVAAEMYVKADDLAKAAEMYAKAGEYEKAAALYEKVKDYEKAADAYEIVYAHTVSTSVRASTTSRAAREFAIRGASAFEKASNYKDAARLYGFAGEVVRASEMLSRSGDDNGAAEMLLEARRFDDAVEAFERAENEKGAIRALALKALDAENFAEAAVRFEKVGDYIQAAALYERIGETFDAGRMFEGAGEHMSAASMFVAAEAWDRAAQNYEKAGSATHAAEYYEKAGNSGKAGPLFEASGQFFEAGEAYAKAGKEEEAMSMFQRVRPSSEHYISASNLLGQLFVKKGRHTLAVKKFQEVVGAKPVTLDNIDIFYNLGRAYEDQGQFASAKSIYEKIILVDFNYKDSNERLAQLEERGSTSGGQ